MGVVMALIVSTVFKYIIKLKEKSYFILELPVYRAPRWKNVGITMVEKAKIFITDAGRVILFISLLLWFLSSFGPPARMQAVQKKYDAAATLPLSSQELASLQPPIYA